MFSLFSFHFSVHIGSTGLLERETNHLGADHTKILYCDFSSFNSLYLPILLGSKGLLECIKLKGDPIV